MISVARVVVIGIVLFVNPPTSLAAQESASASSATLQTPDFKMPSKAEVERFVSANLAGIKSPDKKNREDAISSLRRDLMIAVNQGTYSPRPELKRELSGALVALYTKTSDKDFSHPSIRRGLISAAARFGDNEIAKPFILGILEKGTKEERNEALGVLGVPGGISGPEIYDKVEALVKRGLIPIQARTTYLSRIDKVRALPEVLRDVNSSRDKRIFVHSARVLQNSYRRPEDFKRIIPRIEELGLAESGSFDGKSNGLFWIDAQLLATFVESADGPDLQRVLTLMTKHSPLVVPETVPTLIRKLEHAQPTVRALSALVLETAMGYSQADREGIKTALRMATERESDPTTRKSLQDSMVRIERREERWRKMMERLEDGQK